MNSWLICFVFAVAAIECSMSEDPEINMNVSQIIQRWGYPVEEYDVVTSDGYILTIQRIPHGRNGRNRKAAVKPVVFLQHGLLGSSVHFVLNLPNESLGFILADEGFDVWLGNSRGNTYARRHKTLCPDSDAFWDFSWDTMAKYDIPATLNLILNISGVPSLSYVGHSQGTTIAFAEFSSDQTWLSKVDIFVALAPVAFAGNMISPIAYLSYFTPELEELFKLLGVRDFDLPVWIKRWIAELTCDHSLGEDVCANIVFLICGFDKAQLNETRMPVYGVQILGGTSVKDIVHWAQLIWSKKFCKYDYGSAGNKKHYGQDTPPSYNLTNIRIPTALFSGGNDWLADPKDVALLIPKLSTIIYQKKIEAWDHLDFILGRDAPQLVYNEIIKLLHKSSRIPRHIRKQNREFN